MIYILISSLVSLVILIFLLNTNLKNIIVDIPNKRSMHIKPTPRSGGLSIIFGIFVPLIFLDKYFLDFFLLVLVLSCVSFLDDLMGIKPLIRLSFHLAITILFQIFFYNHLSLESFFICTLIIVWSMNLYNFMDGADGVAAGVGSLGFLSYGIAAFIANEFIFANFCFIISAVLVVFLCFNFEPAKIFMGDCGSISLGFLASAMGIMGFSINIWPYWFPFVIFGVFVTDATFTFLVRLIRKENILRAHRDHFYQKAILMGLSHRNVCLIMYSAMILCSLLSFIIINYNFYIQNVVVATIFLLSIFLAILVEIKWKAYKNK